jgi:DNA-binding beta-propeller fold protein YncE
MVSVSSSTASNSSVVVIDGRNNTVTTTFGSGGRAHDITVDETADVIWVTDLGGPVVEISGATHSVIHSVSVTDPADVAVNPVTDTA